MLPADVAAACLPRVPVPRGVSALLYHVRFWNSAVSQPCAATVAVFSRNRRLTSLLNGKRVAASAHNRKHALSSDAVYYVTSFCLQSESRRIRDWSCVFVLSRHAQRLVTLRSLHPPLKHALPSIPVYACVMKYAAVLKLSLLRIARIYAFLPLPALDISIFFFLGVEPTIHPESTRLSVFAKIDF